MHDDDRSAPDQPEVTGLASATGYVGGDAAATIATAQEAVAPHELNTIDLYAVRGQDGALEVLDLEKYRVQPDRARCSVRPGTVDALSAYVKRHRIEGHTSVWVAPDAGRVTAVIDDHGADAVAEARFRQHRAELELLVTPEWEFWLKRDGELLDQQTFAEHIEEGLDDIREPEAATMLEVAQSIHGTNKATFRQGYKLENGEVKFGYDEDVNIRAGDPSKSGELAIPHELKLGIAPFIGEPAFELTARFRVRMNGGKVGLGYKLDRPDRAVRVVLDGIAERLGAEHELVYRGTPGAGA